VAEPLPGDPPLSAQDDDVVAVEDHDELGPLLWAAGDKFTGV